MSKSRASSAEAYLKRRLSTTSEYPDAYSHVVAQESLWSAGSITVSEQDTTTCVKIVRGDNEITYGYAPVTLEEYETCLPETMDHIKSEPWAFRELRSAEIISSKNGLRLDLIEKLPSGWKAFIDFGYEAEDFCNILDKTVVVTPKFANKFHYLTLAHEVGHAIDSTVHPHLYEPRYRNRSVKYASQLESERNANAFALFQMRRFLSADPMELYNVDEFRENLDLAIQTYVDEIVIERAKSRNDVRGGARTVGRVALETLGLSRQYGEEN